MHHHSLTARTLSLLAISGICCLATGSAQAQRPSAHRGNSSRAASTATASTQAATSATTGATTCPTSATSGASTSSTGATTGTTATGTTTTGTTTANTASVSARSAAKATQTLLASGVVSAQRTTANQLAVQWTGNTSNVKTVYVAVLNANRQMLQQTAITQLPVQANLTLSSTARYYGVQVVFTNGTSQTMTAAIR